MNRRKLTQHLAGHDCRLYRRGGGHDIWTNAGATLFMPVPRHTDVSQGVAENICRHFGIPKPDFK
jgi:tryptophanase